MVFMAEFIHSMASSALMYPGGATGEEVTGGGRALGTTLGLAGASVPGNDRQREVGGSVLEQEASW